jgi:hypothetical protein
MVEIRNTRLRQQSYTTLALSSTSIINNNSNGNEENDDDDSVELIDVLEWMETVAPMFPYLLPTFFQYLLFPRHYETTNSSHNHTSNTTTKVLGRTTFTIPQIITTSTTTTTTTQQQQHDTLLNPHYSHTSPASSLSSTPYDVTTLLPIRHFIMACWNKTLNGYYYPIYNSNQDGLSFNRLQNAILGYGGPTIFIVQSVSGGIFGAYTGTAWKESKDFYGNTDSFLYQLQPNVAVYHPKSTGSTNYMYCNSTARSRGYDQQAHGIGFGGTVQQPRLFLSESMEDGTCIASAQDLTYDNGTLLPNVGTNGHYYYNSNNYNNNNSNHLQDTANPTPSAARIQHHRSIFDVECIEVYGVSDDWDVIDMAIGSRTINRANKDELIRKARKVDKAQFLEDFQSGIIASKAFVHRQQIDGRAEVDDDCLLKKQNELE